jgi:cytochrome c
MMKRVMVAALVAAALGVAGTASAQEALATSSGCLKCHDVNKKKVGPAFKDVAAKFKGNADAAATLEKQLTSGQGHPKVKVSGDDLSSLIKWVLSQ